MLPEYKKILYATDLSEGARLALDHAAALVRRFDAELTVLHVLPDTLEQMSEEVGVDLAGTFGETAAHWIGQGDMERAAEAIHARLEREAREECPSPAAKSHLEAAEIRVLCGDASKLIIDEAEKGGHDLIVMGTHGHGGVLDMVMGSVARDTIRKASVPVLVVPLQDNRP